jgi:hypothetical protein
MSILNAKLNQYAVWFPKDFFYPEIRERWTPVVKRLKLQYQTLEDFFNASVQAVTFPELRLDPVIQPQSQFSIRYRGGKELEPILDKMLTVTFKLTEGFITYWMLFEQIESYMKYAETSPFWPSMYISFLDHHGYELVVFEFQKIIPIAMSQFNISYASVAAEFSTFTLNLAYNRYKIYRRLSDEKDVSGVPENIY